MPSTAPRLPAPSRPAARLLRAAVPFALVASLAPSPARAEAPGASAPSGPHLRGDAPRGAGACLVCHAPPQFDAASLARSVHATLACSDCHDGYDFQTHAAKPAALSEAEQALLKKLSTRSTSPAALLSCAGCHAEEADNVAASVHGRWLRESRGAGGPLCTDCHGSPHAIVKASAKDRLARSGICTACHANEAFIKAAGLSGDPVPTYRDSVHGRLVVLGSDRAPACMDCHGAHSVAALGDPASPLAAGERRANTCGKCHSGTSASFAATMTHTPLGKAHPGPHWTHVFFSWLTTLTLSALFLHILLDLGAEVRVRLRRRRAGHASWTPPPSLPRSVRRLDIHQRIQHWMLIASVLLLVLTGWPLRAAAVGPSRSIAAALGGPGVAAVLHRVCAVLMIGAGVYHLLYLGWLWSKKKLELVMLPRPKDLVDAFQNVAYFLGLRKERPRFDRFSYVEKFDYWAVFWGVAIMTVTGFVYWFPTRFAAKLPFWVVSSAQLAHGEEATLAALALFVWHFYNVHLRPSIFPMNWAWLNGQISTEALREEHPLEFERLFPEGPPPSVPLPKPEPGK